MIKKLKLLTVFLVILPIMLISEQNFGRLSGRVTDKITEQPISGVAIFLQGSRAKVDSQKASMITDERGKYLIKNLKPQRYTVTFRVIGYKTLSETNVTVKPNWNTTLNAKLEKKMIEIPGIKVGSKYFVKSEDAVVSAKNMDIREIKQQPGGVYDVQRSIQALPAVVSGTDQNNEIIVRGGKYGENLFVVDNIELANPNHFAWQGTGGGPVNIIQTELINNIDFYAGAFPAKYGNKASSVLDITLREGNKNKYIGKLDVGMAGFGGMAEGPLPTEGGSFVLSYHKSFLSLIKSSFGLTAVPKYQSFQGKQVINISNNNKLILNQIWADDKIFIESEPDENNSAYGDEENDIDSKTGQYTLGVTWKNTFNPTGYYLLTLYRNRNRWNQDILKTNTDSLNFYNHSYETLNTAKFDFNYQLSERTKFKCGVKWENLDMKHDKWGAPDTLMEYIYDDLGNIDSSFAVIDSTTGEPYVYSTDIDENLKSNRYSGYLQLNTHFWKYFNFNSGIRYQHLNFNNNTDISPRLGLTINLPQRYSLNFAYGKHFQNPEYYQLTSHPQNDDLKSKYTEQYIAGLEHYFSDDLKSSIEVYYKKYQDIPISKSSITPDPHDSDPELINKGEGYAKGVELFLQKHIKKELWGTLSYSYSISKAKDMRNDKWYNWDFDYRHIFTGLIGYKFEFMQYDWYQKLRDKWWAKALSWTYLIPSDETEIAFKYRYMGGKPYTAPTYHKEWRKWVVEEDEEINTERFPAYKRFDLFITHKWFLNKINLITYLNIENIFNHPNIWNYSYQEDGTRDTIYQTGRMIVGGVKLEF